MRVIISSVLAQLEAKELRPFWLLELDLSGGMQRFTDCDVPIVTGGDRFDPRGFNHDGAKYTINRIVDSLSVEIDNVDEILSTDFIGGDPQGTEVTLKEIVLNSSYAVIDDPITWFFGTIDEWDSDEEKIRLTVVGPNYTWSKRTGGRHPSSCRWRVFKGTECAYAGAGTSCDRTYARCASFSNTNNFGGFRWLPSIQDKEVVWGRKAA